MTDDCQPPRCLELISLPLAAKMRAYFLGRPSFASGSLQTDSPYGLQTQLSNQSHFDDMITRKIDLLDTPKNNGTQQHR